jgi:hypothetical protein
LDLADLTLVITEHPRIPYMSSSSPLTTNTSQTYL